MTPIWAFVRLSRPHFLLGGALMYAIGATNTGTPSLDTYLLGQGMVTFAQLTAHYVNEYADREVDSLVTNRTLFSGGSGVLAESTLKPDAALQAAWVTTVVALMLAIWVATISPPAAAFGLAALTISWTYSMPPIRLLDTGWGEIATSLVVTGGVPVVGSLVASGYVGSELAWKMVVLFPVHMAMVLAFELPDIESDGEAGKTVLAVRIGSRSTRRVIAVLLLTPIVVVAAAVASEALVTSTWWVVAVGMIPSVIVVGAARRQRHGTLTAAAVATLVTLGVGLLVV